MSEPITLDPVVYWKLKTVMTESRLLELQVRDLIRTQEQKVKAVMLEASLDPAVAYSLDDAAHTATFQDK